jgi:AI-2 transport protein TqsA
MENNLPREQSLTVLKIAAFIIIGAGMYFAKSIIAPFLMALFISIICAQPIFWLEKRKVPKGLSVLIVMIGILALFFGFGYLIGGTISSFTSDISKYETRLNSIIDNFIQFLNYHRINVTKDQFPNLLDPSRILNFTVIAVNELVNMLGNTFLVFLTIIFMLLELSSIPEKIRAVFKGPAGSMDYLEKIIDSIRHYLGIKTIISIVTTILIYIALSIIGLDYAILWALIAGLMNYIPNIGSIIAAVPALLFALVELGVGSAVWTLISFMTVNNILGNFIEPKIMGKGLGLSTLVVFMSLIFWGFILGTVGMFLSVPLTTSLKIVLEQNENTRWAAILLGTTEDARNYPGTKDKIINRTIDI